MRRTISVLAGSLALASACARGPHVVLTGPNAAAASAPRGVLAALAGRYPKWQLASVDPSAGAGCTAREGASPSLAAGDFNADGLGDQAFQIVTSEGARIVAVLSHLHDYSVPPAVTPPAGAAGVLSVRPRGQKFVAAGTNIDQYFSADTLVVTGCDGKTAALRWTGQDFDVIPLG